MIPLPPDHPAAEHLDWALQIARDVRRRFKFQPNSQEAADIDQAAVVELLLCLRRFDPAGNPGVPFRGYAKIAIKQECRREAWRLRNGGLYDTTRHPHLAPRCLQGVGGGGSDDSDAGED